MNIENAQQDMRFAYYGGAPGMLVSATVWVVAGAVAMLESPQRAIWTLFIGAMFIHPLAMAVSKMLGRPGTHARDNPLAGLAMANTFWLLLCLPLAYAASLVRIEWFFPAMLLVIGGRFFTFTTLYGNRLYWACGAALAAAGYLLASSHAAPAWAAFTGGAIEAAFGIAIFTTTRDTTAEVASKQMTKG